MIRQAISKLVICCGWNRKYYGKLISIQSKLKTKTSKFSMVRPLSGPKPPSSENYAGGQGGRVGPLVGSRGKAPGGGLGLNSFWYHKLKKSILLVAERAHEHQKNSFSNPIINAFLSSFLKFLYNPGEELSNESRKTAPASFEIYYSESGMYSDRKIWRSRSTHQVKYR